MLKLSVKYIIIVFVLVEFCSFNSLYGQPNRDKAVADSILREGEKKQDKGFHLESVKDFEKSLFLYKALENIKGIGDCYSYLGTASLYLGNYNEALNHYNESIKSYESINDDDGVARVLNNIGGIYFFLGNYPKALESYIGAISKLGENDDKVVIASTAHNIGIIYSKIGDYSNAMKYFKESYQINLSLNRNKEIAQNLSAIGNTYLKLNDTYNAEKNLKESLIIAEKNVDKQAEIESLRSLGAFYQETNNPQKAFYYFNKCLKSASESKSLNFIAESKLGIGRIYLQSNALRAIEYCGSALTIGEGIGLTTISKDACKCLYEGYKRSGNTQKALYYFEKTHLFSDSLKSEETANRLMSMEFQNKQLTDSIAYVKKEHTLQIKHKEEIQRKEAQRNAIIVSLGFVVIIAGGIWSRLALVRKSKKALQFEKDRSEELLLNILPEEIAEELKKKGIVNARSFNLASILFTDFKSFTETSEKLTPHELVEELNVCFKAFDHIVEKYDIEKIKTIGDAYMAAGGIPTTNPNVFIDIIHTGLEMQEFMLKRREENILSGKPYFDMRVGIHAGPIVAGVVGVKKFQYDIWGDTVNTASRIESSGEVGKVNISERLYLLAKDNPDLEFFYRGKILAKGKGEIKMYFVTLKTPHNSDNKNLLFSSVTE